MSSSYSISESFTITHARHIAARVATDLQRMQRFYSRPTDSEIASYEAELIEYLKAGYLGTVTYGFRRNGNWIAPTLVYTAQELSGDGPDDDPGKIRPGWDISNATFWSYLTYSTAWNWVSTQQREAFEKLLPFQRTSADAPSIDGRLVQDRTYSAGGRALSRSSVVSW